MGRARVTVAVVVAVAVAVAAAAALVGCHRRDEPAARAAPAHRSVSGPAAADTFDASPYAALGVSPTLVTAQPGQSVWAAAEDDRGQWTLRLYTAVSTAGAVWTVAGHGDRRAPQGLVAAVADTLPAPGTPVLIATDRPTFGLMKEARGDQALVSYMYFGGGIRQSLVDAETVRAVDPDREAFGTPVAIDVGGEWHGGVVVGRADGGWQVIRGSGKNSTVERIPADRVRFVDPSVRHAAGAAVLFRPDASTSDPAWIEGTIVGPTGEGLGYRARTAGDRIVSVSWASVVARP